MGSIDRIYISTDLTTSLINPEQLAEWTNKLESKKLIELQVIGDMPEPETAELGWVDGMTLNGNTTFSVNFRILEMNDINYDFVRRLMYNPKLKLWFKTSGGYMYGGKDGLVVNIKVKFSIPEDRSDITKANFTAKWIDDNYPDRIISPI